MFVRLHLDRGRWAERSTAAAAGADIRNLRDVHKASLKVSIAVLIFLIQRSGKTIDGKKYWQYSILSFMVTPDNSFRLEYVAFNNCSSRVSIASFNNDL